jgi:D-hydantoinase
LQQKLLAEGNNGPEAHAYSRPAEVEGEATNRAIMIADMAGTPLYVVHTSCEQSHEAIRRARQKGMRVWGEPLIQHLTLDESEYAHPDWDHAARRVMSPPFRNKMHQDSLWAGLSAGSLQVVATDHCAFTTEQKRYGVGDFTKIPNGTGGLEDRMPMLWTYGVSTGRLTMNEFVAVTSTNIAKILNCYPKKGAVLVGADADLVVWDPEKSKTITADSQQSAIDYNVFEGKQVKGLPRYTLTRGHVAIHDGEIKDPGRARQVRQARTGHPGQQGAVDLEGTDLAAQGRTLGHSGDRGIMAWSLPVSPVALARTDTRQFSGECNETKSGNSCLRQSYLPKNWTSPSRPMTVRCMRSRISPLISPRASSSR